MEKESEGRKLKAEHDRKEMKSDKEPTRTILMAQGKSAMEISEFFKILLQK